MGVQINGSEGNVIATKGTYSGNVTIGGTLTYEDVTNIDSVGLVTARNGIEIGARPGVAASISVDGNMIISGISTFTKVGATAVFNSGAANDGRLEFHYNNSRIGLLAYHSDRLEIQSDSSKDFTVRTNGANERLRIESDGNIAIGGFSGADAKLEVRDDASTGIIVRCTNTQSTDTNKALRVRNNSDTNTFSVSHKGQGYFASSVGINSTSPSATLEISDIGSTGPCVLLRGSTYTEGDVTVPDGENFNFGHWNYSSSAFTERLRITSAGRALIQEGTFSERTLGVSAKLQIEGTDAPTSTISVTRNSNDTNPAYIHFGKSRGTATGANTILQTGDYVGGLFFYGADGNDIYSESAFIRAGIATGRTQASTTMGSNSTPGVLEFATTLDGDASARKHVEIDSDGIFKMMTGNTENDNNSGFDTNQNPVGFYKIKVNDETNSADILMPKPGCLVIIQPYSTYPAYPQPKASIAYVDSGASKRADVFLDPFNQLSVKTSVTSDVSACDNDKYTVMPGNAYQTLRITNRLDTDNYTFCITMI